MTFFVASFLLLKIAFLSYMLIIESLLFKLYQNENKQTLNPFFFHRRQNYLKLHSSLYIRLVYKSQKRILIVTEFSKNFIQLSSGYSLCRAISYIYATINIKKGAICPRRLFIEKSISMYFYAPNILAQMPHCSAVIVLPIFRR